MQLALSYDDVLLIPRKSNFNSRKQTDISVEFCGQKYSAPIIMSPMTCVSSPQMIHYFCKQKLVPTIHRYFNDSSMQYDYVYLGLAQQIILDNNNISPLDWQKRKKIRERTIDFNQITEKLNEYINQVYFSVGSVYKYKQWIDYLFNKGIKKFCIDMAHGHSKLCIDTIKYLRKLDKNIKIIAGNICTSQAMIELQKSGVSAIRTSIGSGQCCSTRQNTGFGVPMITSLIDISQANKNANIIADGGIRTSGDIVKCMYFGADIVMLGKMLASTSLSPSLSYNKKLQLIPKQNIVYEEPREPNANLIAYKQYLGMASKRARRNILNEGSIEGVNGLIKYTGYTEDIIKNIKLNLHSALSYGGSKNWNEFRTKVNYNIISNSSLIESKTHLDYKLQG